MAQMKFPRLAVRALIVQSGRLLLVNAYPGTQSQLWCAPGGGVYAQQSLPANLRREVYEELGLEITVGGLLGVNEFHAPDGSFHQVDLFFRAKAENDLPAHWKDTDKVVNRHIWLSEEMLETVSAKPDSLAKMAFHGGAGLPYDALERIVS